MPGSHSESPPARGSSGPPTRASFPSWHAPSAGLLTPPTAEVVRGDDDALGTFGFPAIVKPPRSRLPNADGKSSGSARYVSKEQAGETLETLRDGGCLVQPYLSGTLSSVCGVSWEGELVCAVHQRSLRIWPVPTGVSAYAETTPPDFDLERGVGRLLRNTGWSGIFQAQFIRSPDGDDCLIDLNPRIYGSLALAVASGLNLPAIWLDLLLGRRPKVGSYRVGARFRQEEKDALALMRMLADGGRIRVLRGMMPRPGTVHAIFSLRDPMPLLTSATRLTKRLASFRPKA